MVFSNDGDNVGVDIFGERLSQWSERMSGQEDYGVFTVDEATLKSMNESEVFVIDLREQCKSFPVRFFKNTVSDVFITMCKFCHTLFKTEEYENAYLKNKNCPLCGNSDAPVDNNSPSSYTKLI
jgi:hypothetical protein